MTDSIAHGRLTQVRGRGQRFFAAVTLVGLLLGVATAQNDRKLEPALSSDEMVGTLPATYEVTPSEFELISNPVRVALYVEGEWSRVSMALDNLRGSAHVSLERLHLGGVRAVIRGEARLDLPALEFQDGSLRVGVMYGAQFGQATIGIVHGQRMVSRTAILPWQDLAVPMAHLVNSGLLDTGLAIVTQSPLGRRSFVTIDETAGSVRIVQGE